MPEKIRPYLVSGELTAGHVKAIAAMENRDEMVRLAKNAAEKGLSVREVERQVSKKPAKSSADRNESEQKNEDPFYQELELAMNTELGRRVRIHAGKGKGGTIEIAFYDQEDLRSIAYRLAGEESF